MIQKFLICLVTNSGIIFLIVGSGNFGPAVARPARRVPTPLGLSMHVSAKLSYCILIYCPLLDFSWYLYVFKARIGIYVVC